MTSFFDTYQRNHWIQLMMAMVAIVRAGMGAAYGHGLWLFLAVGVGRRTLGAKKESGEYIEKFSL